jgi:four helix bundle protein
MPRSTEAYVVGKQVLRSATSVAANYRATCRARSSADFVAKLGVVLEEIDETVYWLELISDTKILPVSRLQPLQKEANELLAIFNRSYLTARGITAKTI